MNYGLYFKNIMKMTVISVFTYFVCLEVYKLWDKFFLPSMIALIFKIILITLVCAIVYSLLAALFRIPYVFELYGRVKGKIIK